jgi:hypothetical protein
VLVGEGVMLGVGVSVGEAVIDGVSVWVGVNVFVNVGVDVQAAAVAVAAVAVWVAISSALGAHAASNEIIRISGIILCIKAPFFSILNDYKYLIVQVIPEILAIPIQKVKCP